MIMIGGMKVIEDTTGTADITVTAGGDTITAVRGGGEKGREAEIFPPLMWGIQ